jgi:UDP-N-acetylglucosamine:LPS N-acetylglucosamine transferase
MHTDAAMGHHVEFLRTIYQTVDCHIQTVPLCRPQRADLTAGPISRKLRLSSEQVRGALGIAEAKKVVLLTTGGFREKYRFLQSLSDQQGLCFVVPGGSERFERQGNVILLPYRSDFFHPDLVNAADVVIGKAGYSTIAEVYQAGVPFGYVPRPNFRETDKLIEFIKKEMKGVCIGADDFLAGKWIREVRQLLDFPCIHRQGVNGSRQTAAMITNMLNETHA